MSIHGLLHALSFGLQLSHGINSSIKLDSIYVFRHVVKPSFVLHIVSVGQAFEAELFFFFFGRSKHGTTYIYYDFSAA